MSSQTCHEKQFSVQEGAAYHLRIFGENLNIHILSNKVCTVVGSLHVSKEPNCVGRRKDNFTLILKAAIYFMLIYFCTVNHIQAR